MSENQAANSDGSRFFELLQALFGLEPDDERFFQQPPFGGGKEKRN